MSSSLPRMDFVQLCTPVVPLSRLTRELNGPRIFIKRDDLTCLGGGGNKVRKLEFLVADAVASGADTLITVGAVQSNHCRQTAAAAAVTGMRCILVLRGHPPAEVTGNVLLDHVFGAEIRWSGDRTREEVMSEAVSDEWAAEGRPYPIPLGGSTPLGALGFARAFEELMGQTAESFDRIVFASSSGGTHAGLAAGAFAAQYPGEILGISVDEELETLQKMVAPIATGAASLLGTPHDFLPEDIHANADYLGQGYAVMGAPEREAIELFARLEGILLDPVYTGRAAAGLIDLIRRGVIRKDESILFWHTGGVPAIYAYAKYFGPYMR
jgi:D-cysteine desulfhydrase family pyridoxal phosphate-dependent enzyme